ncbi:Peptidase family U32 [uncultured archaeon]|nr:Peptidase family U32 [uncultured archaeon]
MKISAPTNWDYAILDEINKINSAVSTKTKVAEIYSSIKKSITGSARSASLVPDDVDAKYAEEYIKKAKGMGLEFNYLVNSSCLGNLEYHPEYRVGLIDYLKWIDSTKAKFVSVANPFLVDLIKKHTNLKIVLSIVSDPKSVNRIKLLERDGVDRVVLSTSLNRDFSTLKKICSSSECELEILVNESCLNDCPYKAYHYSVSSHSSQSDLKITSFDYCLLKCSIARLKDPVQIIRSSWVRPEDMHFYEELGLDYAKLSGRIMPTKWILNSMLAYSKNKYKGNLFDIIDQQKMFSKDFAQFVSAKEFGPLNIMIDNSKLEGFFQKIISAGVDCGQDCFKCKICENYAKKAILSKRSVLQKHGAYLETVLRNSLAQ